MYATFIKLYTRPGKKQKLIDLLKWDGEVAEASEPETLRFEFYEDPVIVDITVGHISDWFIN